MMSRAAAARTSIKALLDFPFTSTFRILNEYFYSLQKSKKSIAELLPKISNASFSDDNPFQSGEDTPVTSRRASIVRTCKLT